MCNKIKYFKIKYFKSVFRIIKYKIFKGIKLLGIRYCFEDRVRLEKNTNGSIIMNDKIYLSRNCEIIAENGVIEIGYNTFFNTNCKIVSIDKIKIGENCLFGPNVLIYDHDHIFTGKDLICKQGLIGKKINIGSDVWIGGNSVITRGITIGDRVVVAANSVVTKDLKSNALYGGNPAKFIKNI